MKEIYKPIPNYEGLYEVSNLGNVKSLRSNLILKQRLNIDGYKRLNISVNGLSKTFNTHQLVASAFLNHKKDSGLVIDHINNNKLDNRLTNLQLITQRKNSTKDIDRTKSKSKKLGAHWHKLKKRWCSSIVLNKKSIYLGTFETEEEASLAYKNKLQTLNK